MSQQDPLPSKKVDEKPADSVKRSYPADAPSPSDFSSWFGGRNVTIGPRIGPVLDSISLDESSGDESSTAILAKQLALEDGHAIQYRTCSWQKVHISSFLAGVMTG